MAMARGNDNLAVKLVIQAQDLASKVVAKAQAQMQDFGDTSEAVAQQIAEQFEALTKEAEKFAEQIKGLEGKRIRLELNQQDIQGKIAQVDADLKSLSDQKIKLEAEGGSAEEIAKLQRKIEALSRTKIQLGLDAGDVEAQIKGIDDQIEGLNGSIAGVKKRLGTVGDDIKSANKPARGFGETIKGFSGAFDKAAGLSSKIFFIGEAFQQVMGIVNAARGAVAGFYDAFVQVNVDLEQETLGVQATLAATQDIFRDGVKIDDPTEAILSLEKEVTASQDRFRVKTLDLVGVTSQELSSLYQTVLQGIGQVGGGFADAENLGVSLAAALGTLKIPLEQARFEVNSLFSGEITEDSDLATRLQISREQVALWKSQGTFIEEVTARLKPFAEANKLATRSIPGFTSNILDIFQEITRIAGQDLVAPIVDQLERLYNAFNAARPTIEATLGQAVNFLVEVFNRGIAVIDALLPSLGRLGRALFDAVGSSAQAVGELFLQLVDAAVALAPAIGSVIDVIAGLSQRFADFAETGVGKAVIKIVAFGAVIGTIAAGIAGLVALFGVVGPAIAGVAGSMASAAAIGGGLAAAFVVLQKPLTAVGKAVGGFLVNSFEKLKNLFERVKPVIVDIAQRMIEFGKSLAPIGEVIKQGVLLGFDLLRVVINVVTSNFGTFFSIARSGFEVLSGLMQTFGETILLPLTTSLNVFGVTGKDAFNAIQTVGKAAFDGFVAIVEKFAATLSNARQFLRDIGLLQEDIKPGFSGLGEAVGGAAEAVGGMGAAVGATGDAASGAAGDVSFATKAVDQLKLSVTAASREIGNEKIRIDADQSSQLAELQSQLDQGLITEREFQNRRAEITNAGIDQQLEVVSSRAADLRAEYEALTEEEKRGAGDQLLEIQKLETEANNLRQQSGEQRLEQQRTLREQERQDLENAQKKADDAIAASVTQREIELQKLRNQGLISEREQQEALTQINADRIDQTLAQEQGRLAGLKKVRAGIKDATSQEAIQAEEAIRASEQRILDLTKERLTTEQELQQQAQEAILRAIDRRAKAAENAATREAQDLEAVLRLYDSLNASLEQQSKLVQAQADLRRAENDLAASNFDIAASLTKNERERQRIQAQGAIAQLEALQEQQAFEDQSLAIQQELERLALRRRETEAEIAEIQAKAALATAEAEQARVAAAVERGEANEQDLEAANLAVRAAQFGIEAAQQQKAITAEEAALLPQMQAIAQRQQDVSQQGQLNQARATVIQALPENSRIRREASEAEINRQLTPEQRQLARSTRGTNEALLASLDAAPTSTLGVTPVLAPAPDLAPLQGVQEAGNQYLETIAANTARRDTPGITVNVSVNGGATNDQTGTAVAATVRAELERLLDRAGALQTA